MNLIRRKCTYHFLSDFASYVAHAQTLQAFTKIETTCGVESGRKWVGEGRRKGKREGVGERVRVNEGYTVIGVS